LPTPEAFDDTGAWILVLPETVTEETTISLTRLPVDDQTTPADENTMSTMPFMTHIKSVNVIIEPNQNQIYF
jgi:hypothetical protein